MLLSRTELANWNFTISAANLVYPQLASSSTKFYVLDPTSNSPTNVVGNIETYQQTTSNDLLVTANSFTEAAWAANGWNANETLFLSEEVPVWATNNLPTYTNKWNMLYMKNKTVSGIAYTIIVFYAGKDPNANSTISSQKTIVVSEASDYTVGKSIALTNNVCDDGLYRFAFSSEGPATLRGTVYVYTLNPTTFAINLEQTISSPSPGNSYRFGSPLGTIGGGETALGSPPAIDINDNGLTMLIGENGNNRTHVYTRTGTTWTFLQTLSGFSGSCPNFISGDSYNIIIGSSSGSTCYIYKRKMDGNFYLKMSSSAYVGALISMSKNGMWGGTSVSGNYDYFPIKSLQR